MERNSDNLNQKRLIELLRHQQVLYRRLRQLAEAQKVLVVQEDTEALIPLLSERQRLVDGLVGLSAQLAPYRERWSTFYGELSEQIRHEVASMLEEANQSLGAILEGDQRDSATLTARREIVGGELAGCGAGGRVSAAYASMGPGACRNTTEARA